MLKSIIGDSTEVTTHDFMVTVEVEPGVDLNAVAEKLAGALSFVEGVGDVTVSYLGEMDAPEKMN